MVTARGVAPKNVVAWLLEKENPSVRYFSLRDLFGKDEADSEVNEARAAIPNSKVAVKILLKQKTGGYWENKGSPYHPKYKSTYWQVMMLGHLGLNKNNAKVRKAFEFVFKLQLSEGGFSSHTRETALEEYEWMRTRTALKEKLQPEANASARSLVREHQYTCLTGNLCAAMLRAGYSGDKRLAKAVDWLVKVQNVDGGWLCPYWKAHVKDTHGCFYGTICPLEAFSEMPESDHSAKVKGAIERGAEFLLMHRLYTADHHRFRVINRQWLRFGFPWFYGYDTLRGLSVLTKLGYVNDDRMVDAVKLLIQKKQPDGRWLLEASPTGRMQTNIEPVGKPSKWITLNALRVLTRLHETKNKRLKEVLSTYAPA
jgi:prenyltransferase beta subunit